MSDKHKLTLETQVAQSKKVKNLTAENNKLRYRAEQAELQVQVLLKRLVICSEALMPHDPLTACQVGAAQFREDETGVTPKGAEL